MDSKLIVLKLFMDELGQQADIDSLDARKAFQKAIYLGQLTGLDLGYRYSWYIRGPYSTSLARDYYQLAEAVELGDRSFEGKSLNDHVKGKLAPIRGLFEVPSSIALSKPYWLETLASWHYLRAVSPKRDEDARRIMETEKPHLANYVPAAEQALRKCGLLK